MWKQDWYRFRTCIFNTRKGLNCCCTLICGLSSLMINTVMQFSIYLPPTHVTWGGGGGGSQIKIIFIKMVPCVSTIDQCLIKLKEARMIDVKKEQAVWTKFLFIRCSFRNGQMLEEVLVSYGAKFILVSEESTLTRKENASLCNDECFNRWLAGCLWLWNIFSFIQLFDEIPQIRINFNSTHLW